MSGVCETGREEVQLKAAGNCSKPSENVGVPVSAKRCLQYTGFSVKMCVRWRVCVRGPTGPSGPRGLRVLV